MKTLLSLAAAAALALSAPLQDDAPRLRPDPENVVASRLEGTWQPDPELCERLGARAQGALEFRADPSVVERVPAQYHEPLAELQVFWAGVMTTRRDEEVRQHPMLLVTLHGNPHVLYFRERDGEPMGDAESFNVALAPAKERGGDVLFVGGDFNNQPFSAWRRAPR